MSLALGMPSLIELPELDATVDLCRRLGLSFIELNMNMPTFCPEALPADAIRRASEDSGVAFTLHLPEELDLASFHPPIRSGHLQRCLDTIEWAGSAGITLANMHINTGVYFTLPDRKVWIYERYTDLFRRNFVEAVKRLTDAGRNCGLKLTIENCGNLATPFVRDTLDELLSLRMLNLTWDIGHDASSGYRDSEVFRSLQNQVVHVHLHDYDGKSNHQVLLSGSVDIAGMLRFADERDLGVVIEVKTAESLAESVRRIREAGLVR